MAFSARNASLVRMGGPKSPSKSPCVLSFRLKAGYDPTMTILLSALAVAFAAFCVWLMVRIINRRERWAKWTLAAAVGLPTLYVAGFGPACWATSHANSDVDETQ